MSDIKPIGKIGKCSCCLETNIVILPTMDFKTNKTAHECMGCRWENFQEGTTTTVSTTIKVSKSTRKAMLDERKALQEALTKRLPRQIKAEYTHRRDYLAALIEEIV